MKIHIKDIISVIKNDGRFQGNQKSLYAIGEAINKVTVSKDNLIEFARKVKEILNSKQ